MASNEPVKVPRLRHDGGAKTGSRWCLFEAESGAAPATVSGERRFHFASLGFCKKPGKAGTTAMTRKPGDLPSAP